jgi:hypothetical protein
MKDTYVLLETESYSFESLIKLSKEELQAKLRELEIAHRDFESVACDVFQLSGTEYFVLRLRSLILKDE